MREDLFHTVTFKGETLGLIASWYTGSTENWQAIVEGNPGIEVTRIRIGDTIRIPGALVVERNPLPQRAVSAANKGTTPAPKKNSDIADRRPKGGSSSVEVSPTPTASPGGSGVAGSQRDPSKEDADSRAASLDDLMEGASPDGALLDNQDGGTQDLDERGPSEADRIRQEAIRQAEGSRHEIPPADTLSDELGEGMDTPDLGGSPLDDRAVPAFTPPPSPPTPSGGGGVKTRDELLEELLN